jgi:hypothetical protein
MLGQVILGYTVHTGYTPSVYGAGKIMSRIYVGGTCCTVEQDCGITRTEAYTVHVRVSMQRLCIFVLCVRKNGGIGKTVG